MPRKNEKKYPSTIKKKYLILCEGIDEWKFLVRFLNSSALEDNSFFSADIEVFNFGGNEELSAYLTALKLIEGFSDVVSLLVIRDAESNAHAAEQQIQRAFRANGLEVPDRQGQWTEGTPRTCFWLFPALGTEDRPGTLEDLCLTILDDAAAETPLEEIDTFVKHLEQDRGQTFSHPHKTRLHTYFSVNNEFVSLKLGEAADAGAFKWSHPNLEPLKDCLSKMEGG